MKRSRHIINNKQQAAFQDTDKMKLRVSAVKSHFPKNYDYTTIYQFLFGEIDEVQARHIREVWNLRKVDEQIVRNLEIMAEKKFYPKKS